jgi:hypothetical protein
MEATCPCHRIHRVPSLFAEHLCAEHGADAGQAFVLAQLMSVGHPVAYVIDGDGDVLLLHQLELPL